MDERADATRAFLSRWTGAGGSELANYQLFLTELIELLELPRPEPAGAEARDNAYVFERGITFRHGDGSTSAGRIDLYRRGAFVCECKRVRASAAKGFDDALLRARSQAEGYARALPADEGRPPFLIVVDVGRVIELYAEFSRTGGTYVPYPDPRSHRIPLADLADPAVRERLRAVWLDPLSLDPTRRSARVTRDIAGRLAELAKSLELSGHAAEAAASFLSRCLFTCFAEDIGLLPKDSFRGLLERHQAEPAVAMRMLAALWREMDQGGFSVSLATNLLRFNGKLFKQPDVLPLTPEQIGLLIDAARAQWTEVEPAIFGTLLERALDPEERHALGAHYTPRAYVERLVLPTVIEPLREDWSNARAAALTLAREGALDEALKVVRDFHQGLCRVRVLDPACGSGNFLYVTLEHLKRLEGEVFNEFDALDPDRQSGKLRQQGLALDGDRADPFGGETVDPHQLLGIEVNPRAAAIAEMVLWIGYLQWHFRTRGNVQPPEPVLRDFRNIECRDAVLAWDRIEPVLDDSGRPVTRWDGKSYKASTVTGDSVPDDSARVPVVRYVNPRKAEWPAADFVVGNPPFIGTKRMRQLLGDGYVDAVRGVRPEIEDSADFVMLWWAQAAELVKSGALRQSGLITTKTIQQNFNRRVVSRFIGLEGELSVSFAIPSHPWVDSADGAAVRIALTVLARGTHAGRLMTVVKESQGSDGEVDVQLSVSAGAIKADLRIGANLQSTVPLKANDRISGMGVALHGSGFVLLPEQAAEAKRGGAHVIRGYVGGRDLLQEPRERYVIDFSGLSQQDARLANAVAFQRVIDHVKPERDHNSRKSIRELWWRFGWERPHLRRAIVGLRRYIGTTETAKHRVFQFIDGAVLADHMVVCVATDDALILGVLSSSPHLIWSLVTGGTLEDRPRYNKNRCWDPFPFPSIDSVQSEKVRLIAEQIDTHRKRQQAAHPELTLTGVYNVLEKLRRGEPLNDKERRIHEQGLVSVLRELHDDLDRAVFAAYGWNDLADRLVGRPGATTPWPEKPAEQAEAEEELLTRLVALNAERAEEEARGLIRWLRPDYQNPGHTAASSAATQTDLAIPDQPEAADDTPEATPAATTKQAWPKTVPEQARAIADLLAQSRTALSLDAIASHYTARGRWRDRLPQLLDTLVALGRARQEGSGWRGV